MLTVVLWFLLVVLACLGVVQLISWWALQSTGKQGKIYKVVPVGGNQEQVRRQLALAYAGVQWEATAECEEWILYNAGLDPEGEKDCKELGTGGGIRDVSNLEALEALVKGPFTTT